MNKFEHNFLNSEEESLIGRYEEMLEQGTSCYFDVSEFEDIIDYYGEHSNMIKAMQAVKLAELLHPFSPSIQLSKAVVYAFGGKPDKALRILSGLEKSSHLPDLNLFRMHLTKAYALILTKHIDEGMHLQQSLLQKVRKDDELINILAIVSNGLMAIGEYQKLVSYLEPYSKSVQLPSFVLGNIAYSYAEQDEVDKALHYYKLSLDQNPFDAVLWCDYADLLDDEESIAAYDYALLLDEKMVDAYRGKAEALCELERDSEALDLLEKALKLCPYDEVMYDMLAQLYVDSNDLAHAQECYTKMLDENPYNPDLWNNLAHVCCGQGKYKEALSAYDYVLLLDDSRDVVYACKADVYLSLGLPDEAKKMYEQVLAKNPYDSNMRCSLGLIFEDKNDLLTAHACYSKAIAVDCNNARAFYHMALLMSKMQKPDVACDCAWRAVMLDQNNPQYWYVLASMLWRKGEVAEMLRALEKVMQYEHEHELLPEVVTMLSDLLEEGMVEQVINLLHYVDNKDVEDVATCNSLAVLFYHVGDIAKCLYYLEKVLSATGSSSITNDLFENFPELLAVPEVINLYNRYRK